MALYGSFVVDMFLDLPPCDFSTSLIDTASIYTIYIVGQLWFGLIFLTLLNQRFQLSNNLGKLLFLVLRYALCVCLRKAILKEISNGESLPVRLEFQGKVRPFSCGSETLCVASRSAFCHSYSR